MERQMITTADKLACLKREIAMRKRVYPRWVEAGRLSSAKAADEIAIMEAIMEDYRSMAEKERLL